MPPFKCAFYESHPSESLVKFMTQQVFRNCCLFTSTQCCQMPANRTLKAEHSLLISNFLTSPTSLVFSFRLPSFPLLAGDVERNVKNYPALRTDKTAHFNNQQNILFAPFAVNLQLWCLLTESSLTLTATFAGHTPSLLWFWVWLFN